MKSRLVAVGPGEGHLYANIMKQKSEANGWKGYFREIATFLHVMELK